MIPEHIFVKRMIGYILLGTEGATDGIAVVCVTRDRFPNDSLSLDDFRMMMMKYGDRGWHLVIRMCIYLAYTHSRLSFTHTHTHKYAYTCK